MPQLTQQAKFFKALTHPVRLEILNLLRTGEECVCHMEAVLGYRQAYISQHLSILRDAGLIDVRRDGWNVFYHVSRLEIFKLMDTAGDISSASMKAEPVSKRRYSESCPCPKCTNARMEDS
jgi:ArsR family transcriptional regulator